MAFLKKISFGANWSFWIRKSRVITLDPRKGFFEILRSDRGQEVYGTYINGFHEKNLILSKWAILIQK